jgi:hypothetical protein
MKVAIIKPVALTHIPKETVLSIEAAEDYLKNALSMGELPEIEIVKKFYPETFPIDANRNMAVATILEEGFDTTIWLDMDQTFPIDFFVRMLKSPHRITAGVYHLKVNPYNPIVFRETGDSGFTWFKPIIFYPENDYFQADMIGMGAVRIDTVVFKQIAEKQIAAGEEFPEFFRYGQNPITVEMVDGIKNDTQKKHVDLKRKYKIRDVSEDVYFWRQVKELTDYKIMVDPRIQCGHVGKLVADHVLFKSFRDGVLDRIKVESPEKYEKLMGNICRADQISSEN